MSSAKGPTLFHWLLRLLSSYLSGEAWPSSVRNQNKAGMAKGTGRIVDEAEELGWEVVSSYKTPFFVFCFYAQAHEKPCRGTGRECHDVTCSSNGSAGGGRGRQGNGWEKGGHTGTYTVT